MTTSASERKRRFRAQLEKEGVYVLDQKGRKTAWDVSSPSGEKIVWLHYDRWCDWWTVRKSPSYDFIDQSELIHVFLGPDDNDYFVVPHDDFKSEFEHYSDEEDEEWILNASGEAEKTKTNLEILENYRSLEPITA